MTRPTSDHAGDRPDDWAAPGAALVRSAATEGSTTSRSPVEPTTRATRS